MHETCKMSSYQSPLPLPASGQKETLLRTLYVWKGFSSLAFLCGILIPVNYIYWAQKMQNCQNFEFSLKTNLLLLLWDLKAGVLVKNIFCSSHRIIVIHIFLKFFLHSRGLNILPNFNKYYLASTLKENNLLLTWF